MLCLGQWGQGLPAGKISCAFSLSLLSFLVWVGELIIYTSAMMETKSVNCMLGHPDLLCCPLGGYKQNVASTEIALVLQNMPGLQQHGALSGVVE